MADIHVEPIEEGIIFMKLLFYSVHPKAGSPEAAYKREQHYVHYVVDLSMKLRTEKL